MIPFASSTLATLAVVVAGWFGFSAHEAGSGESPVREWQNAQTLQCESPPQNSRVAAMCALLDDDASATP